MLDVPTDRNTSQAVAALARAATAGSIDSPNHTTAGRASAPQLGQDGGSGTIAGRRSPLRGTALPRASQPPNGPVIADHVVGPRALVQSIHVLRNERESVSLAPARDQLMAGVGLTSRDSSAPPVIPLPDQLRVAPERLRGRELLRPERSPEATGSTKRRDTACRGNSCACEHRQPARRRDPRRDLSHLVRHVCTMP